MEKMKIIPGSIFIQMRGCAGLSLKPGFNKMASAATLCIALRCSKLYLVAPIVRGCRYCLILNARKTRAGSGVLVDLSACIHVCSMPRTPMKQFMTR